MAREQGRVDQEHAAQRHRPGVGQLHELGRRRVREGGVVVVRADQADRDLGLGAAGRQEVADTSGRQQRQVGRADQGGPSRRRLPQPRADVVRAALPRRQPQVYAPDGG